VRQNPSGHSLPNWVLTVNGARQNTRAQLSLYHRQHPSRNHAQTRARRLPLPKIAYWMICGDPGVTDPQSAPKYLLSQLVSMVMALPPVFTTMCIDPCPVVPFPKSISTCPVALLEGQLKSKLNVVAVLFSFTGVQSLFCRADPNALLHDSAVAQLRTFVDRAGGICIPGICIVVDAVVSHNPNFIGGAVGV